MRLALFEPDIPQNTGTLIRLAACMGLPLDVIEPCGFPWGDRALKRAGMDYVALADVTRHVSWGNYNAARERGARLVLLTTRSAEPYTGFAFRPDDILLLGRESAGVPQAVADIADLRLRIPMRQSMRSLNVAIAAALVLGEAKRQTGEWSALSCPCPPISKPRRPAPPPGWRWHRDPLPVLPPVSLPVPRGHPPAPPGLRWRRAAGRSADAAPLHRRGGGRCAGRSSAASCREWRWRRRRSCGRGRRYRAASAPRRLLRSRS